MNLNVRSGKAIRTFQGHSRIRSIAFSPDGYMALSGSKDGTMILWDIRSGKAIKTFQGQSHFIDTIVFNPDGRTAFSGAQDGSIIFWDLNSGIKLLTTVSFTDGEWINITPEGFFNTSQKGLKHLNVLTGPMKVAGIDQYYDAFYRPDIVEAALQGKQIHTGMRMVEIKSAPEVEIVNTVEKISKSQIEVTLKITDQGGGIGDIRLFVNGTAVKTDDGRGLKKKKSDDIYKVYTIALVDGQNIIKAIAYNEANTMNSREVFHNVIALLAKTKPNLYALVIGINEFKNPKLKLNYAVSDARLFAKTLNQNALPLFGKVNIKLLTHISQTDRISIIEALKKAQTLKPNDLFVFYVASHGIVDDGEYFMLASNVGSTSTRKLKRDALSQYEIKNLIANIPTQKKMIVLDTCNSQALGDAIQMAILTRGLSQDTAMKVLSRAIGSTILSASTSTQEALEGYNGHGLFTYVLSEGLKGKADANRDGYIKTTELADYIDDEVPEIAEKVFKRAQYPTVVPSGQPFPIARVR